MATKRTPIGRRPKGKITPAAIEAFRRCLEILEAGSGAAWERDGGRHREYLDAELTIARELRLPPWHLLPTDPTLDDEVMPASLRSLASGGTWDEAKRLRRELLAALGPKGDGR